MKKKFTDETYLRDVTKVQIITKKFENHNAYLVLKRIIRVDEPFIKEITLIDNGYYILEYTPMDKLYNARVFTDKDYNVLEYYFDISLSNGVEDGRPYYYDLYLDIICTSEIKESLRILDEDELENALDNGEITKEEYDLANDVCKKLSKEIQENKNEFIKLDKKQIIKTMENERSPI